MLGVSRLPPWVDQALATFEPVFSDSRNVPSGETLLTAIKDLEPDEITEMINRGAARVLTRAKPHVEFERPVMIAIDMTYIAYYSERDECAVR